VFYTALGDNPAMFGHPTVREPGIDPARRDGDRVLAQVSIGAERMRTGRRVGAVTDEVVMVDERGRILLGPNVKTPAGHFSPGPFHWATP
jgi:hypothetical protein